MARAIELRQPALTPYVYFKNTGGEDITIALTDFAGTVTLEFSVDGGSTWNTIGTTSATTYTWSPTTGQYNIIFDAGDPTEELLVRGDDGTGNASVTVTACKISMEPVNIKPDGGSTSGSGDLSIYGNHSDPMHYLDAVNIIWSEFYDSPTDSYDVYVVSNADVETLLYSGVSKAEMNLSWVFGAYLAGATPLLAAGDGNRTYRIRIKGTGYHTGNVMTGSHFAITTNAIKQTGSVLEAYRARMDVFKRIAIEKGILVDEALALGQIEAGDGIRVTQRNGEGKRVGADGGVDLTLNDPVDYKKAFNLVIEADVPSVPRQKRAMQGWINPSTPVGDTYEAGEFYLGTMYSGEIDHDWNLGVKNNNPNHVGGQTMSHYQIHLTHVDAENSLVQPQHEIKAMVETKDANTITIYAVKKGGEAHEPSLAKDIVSNTLLDTWFFYTLEEVIPNPPVEEE